MKVILLSKVIPRNFILRSYESRSPYIGKAGSLCIAVWDLENIMTFVYSGFNFILHLAHHLASLSRSLCRYSAAKSIFAVIFLLTAHWPASSFFFQVKATFTHNNQINSVHVLKHFNINITNMYKTDYRKLKITLIISSNVFVKIIS